MWAILLGLATGALVFGPALIRRPVGSCFSKILEPTAEQRVMEMLLPDHPVPARLGKKGRVELTFKDLIALKKAVKERRSSPLSMSLRPAGFDQHMHYVHIGPGDIETLVEGNSITLTTSGQGDHEHLIEIQCKKEGT